MILNKSSGVFYLGTLHPSRGGKVTVPDSYINMMRPPVLPEGDPRIYKYPDPSSPAMDTFVSKQASFSAMEPGAIIRELQQKVVEQAARIKELEEAAGANTPEEPEEPSGSPDKTDEKAPGTKGKVKEPSVTEALEEATKK